MIVKKRLFAVMTWKRVRVAGIIMDDHVASLAFPLADRYPHFPKGLFHSVVSSRHLAAGEAVD